MSTGTYRWLARYFDHLFEHQRPFPIARKVVFGPLLPAVSSACDLCCGTGELALNFAAQGIRTFAVDLSPDMCRITREKARAALLPVKVIRADMRAFRLPRQVDLITCEFDAINHVPRKSDLARVLKCAALALRPGGHFVFDTNNRLAFETVWNNTWFIDKDPVAMVMRSTHKPGTDKAACEVEFFIREGQIWRRRHEHVEEVCWTMDEIRQALAKAGFGEVQTWDAAPFFDDQLTQPGARTFWRARRNG
ncbi:MAG: class I SAM-dependent methyltransferase [Acidobacteria bacterium]|nr:class I SAM-dependent methyltransferase [Acidobacteriota bacterium]